MKTLTLSALAFICFTPAALAGNDFAASCPKTRSLLANVLKLQEQNNAVIKAFCPKRHEELCRRSWQRKAELQETVAQLQIDLKNQACEQQ